jgi:hypothetical protein
VHQSQSAEWDLILPDSVSSFAMTAASTVLPQSVFIRTAQSIGITQAQLWSALASGIFGALESDIASHLTGPITDTLNLAVLTIRRIGRVLYLRFMARLRVSCQVSLSSMRAVQVVAT